MDKEFNLKDLAQPIPYKWRIQSFSKSLASATCVCYIDSRDCQRILDEVVGPENWQSDFKEVKQNMYAGVGIKVNGDWVWKWDCGVESKTEGEKGEASDAFKRACVHWGIGRFLYEIPIQFIKTNEPKSGNNYPYPVDDYGNKIKDLTVYFSKNNKITYMDKFKKNDENKEDSALKIILEKIEKCTTIDELRVIREENVKLESENNDYKKALAKKYETLSKSEKAI